MTCKCPDDPNGVQSLNSGSPARVLLINPAIHDNRFPWEKWQQPTLLLRLGSYFKAVNAEVRLIDCLHHRSNEKIAKKQSDLIDLDGQKVVRWRYGLSSHAFKQILRQYSTDNWVPDVVYVECFTTYWWRGAAEAIEICKRQFPTAHIAICGAYPLLEPHHARTNTLADRIGIGDLPNIMLLPPDLSLYERPPTFQYVTLGGGERTAEDVVNEIERAVRMQVRHFAFPEHGITSCYAQLHTSILELLVQKDFRANLYAFGNIDPADLANDAELAILMHRAKYRQICFADDRTINSDGPFLETWLEDLSRATRHCNAAGFPARTGALTGSVCIGRAGEDLAERAATITYVAHHVGSVIPWPFQPVTHAQFHEPLENQNGKFFPLRKENHASFREYADLIGLAAVLNAKYRNQTFDFMGEGLIAKMFRESLRHEAWNPPEEVKGTLKLPMISR